jgi:cytochrome d ubiquinol oxidase subunit I
MGVVSGIVMAFQFGTNWSVLAEKAGSIQGPLLGYETFTAFVLEATFLGVVLFGRDRVPRWFYFAACCMLALGTMASSFWILANNSWMQVPVGHTIVDGKIIPSDWKAVIGGPVFLIRWMHMLLAAFLATAMCVIAAGASYLLRGIHRAEAQVMMHWGAGLAAVLIVIQFFFGHLNGKYVYAHQPTKFAAIEARWQHQQPGTEVWFAIPDENKRRNLFAIESPYVGSFLATGTWTAPVYGLSDYPVADWPPVVIPFFAFRIMVGMGLAMLAISWFGNWLRWRGRLETTRWFLWCATLAFPAGFVAVLSGWFVAEVGRQPWVVWGLLRTTDAVTPTLTGPQVLATLIGYVVVAFGSTTFTCCCATDRPAPTLGSPARPVCDRWRQEVLPRRRPVAKLLRGASDGPHLACQFLGCCHRFFDPGLRHPRRLRPRRWHPVRDHAQ